jgi:hypothetical protein
MVEKKTARKKVAKPAKTRTSQAEAKTTSEEKPGKTISLRARCGGKKCIIPKCKSRYKAKGYCKTHYRKWRHGEYGRARYKTCRDLNCRSPMVANRHGFCEEHYQSYYVKGLEQSRPAVEKPPAHKPAQGAKEAAA